VNGQFPASSPGNPYFDLGAGVGAGSIGGNPLGGYLQIGNDPNNANNNGTAVFSNITITPTAIPEPATYAALSLGIMAVGGVISRRRRN